jgi:flagellar protein FliO/FliZ
MKYLRMILLLVLIAPALSYGADAPTNQEVFTKPKPNEPVFPLEDLIQKPLQNNDKLFTDLMNMMATLGLVIGLILFVAWFLKRFANSRLEQMNESSQVRIIERRTLSPKSLLYIIEIDDRRIILAESPQGVTRIADYPATKD